MNKEYCIERGTDSQQVIQLLEDNIYEHNSTRIDKHDGVLFSRIVRDENNEIIAGIAGWTWANACEITQFWVHEKVRNNGIGGMLLEAAEAEAKGKGCRTILVGSYSFQAPHYYERHGYALQHAVDDFPEGHRYCILTKNLAGANSKRVGQRNKLSI